MEKEELIKHIENLENSLSNLKEKLLQCSDSQWKSFSDSELVGLIDIKMLSLKLINFKKTRFIHEKTNT